MKKTRQILIALVCVSGVLVSGCQKETQGQNEQATFVEAAQIDAKAYSEQEVFWIDDEPIYLDEMMYHIMITEFQGKLIGAQFGNEEGYWDSEYDEGITMREAMKDKVIDDVIKYEIFYRQAIEKGETLDETEQNLVQETVTSLKYAMPSGTFELAQLTEEDILRISEKIALATKEYQNFVDSFDIDQDDKQAMKVAEETIISPAYEEIKKEHQIKMNESVWKAIKIGKMTIK